MMDFDLAAELVVQAQALWAHLPEHELEDDAQIAFKTDEAGNLLVAGPDASYKLQEGMAWRYKPVQGGEEVTTWRVRRQINRVVVPKDPGSN
jgi:hypothetical protein